MKTKIGTEVAHITRDSDTTFEVKRSKVNMHGAGAYSGTACCVFVRGPTPYIPIPYAHDTIYSRLLMLKVKKKISPVGD